jgi:hypothetical protein
VFTAGGESRKNAEITALLPFGRMAQPAFREKPILAGPVT